MYYLLRFSIFFVFSILILIIDIKYLIIPDVCLLVLFFGLMMIDFFFCKEKIFYYFISALVAFFIFFIVYLITKKGMGLGDVKYSFVIGYFLGIEKWIFAILLACICGIILFCVGIHLFKWTKIKKLPFAPFLSVGSLAIGVCNFLI